MEGWEILHPTPTQDLRSSVHLFRERQGCHKWGQVPERQALFRINKPDLTWPVWG